MDITLNAAQLGLVDLIRDEIKDVEAKDAHAVWKRLAALGFVEFGLPVEVGGLGLGQLELCLVFEELGARLCDVRFVRGALSVLNRWDTETELPQDIQTLREQAPAIDGGASVTSDLDRVRAAAYLVGVARRGLELGRVRAANRLLGGKPLIERQASAHRVARAAMTTATARLEVWEAACHEGDHRTFTALATAIDAATANAHDAIQLYGAAGTSDPAVIDVYDTAYAKAETWGPISALWRQAASRRYGWEGDGR